MVLYCDGTIGAAFETPPRASRGPTLAIGDASVAPAMLTLRGHTKGVVCVAAADGGHVLIGSGDETVKVWRGDELVRTIAAHTDRVGAVAVLPSGARFVTVSGDGTAKLFTFGEAHAARVAAAAGGGGGGGLRRAAGARQPGVRRRRARALGGAAGAVERGGHGIKNFSTTVRQLLG